MRISDWSSDVCSSDLTLGGLARRLFAAREALRARYPDDGERRRALGAALTEGGALDPMKADADAVARRLGAAATEPASTEQRRGGEVCSRTWRTRWTAYHIQKNNISQTIIKT